MRPTKARARTAPEGRCPGRIPPRPASRCAEDTLGERAPLAPSGRKANGVANIACGTPGDRLLRGDLLVRLSPTGLRTRLRVRHHPAFRMPSRSRRASGLHHTGAKCRVRACSRICRPPSLAPARARSGGQGSATSARRSHTALRTATGSRRRAGSRRLREGGSPSSG